MVSYPCVLIKKKEYVQNKYGRDDLTVKLKSISV